MSDDNRTEEDVLPVELLHRIQSLLPLNKAANTCILSKSWLHAWYTIPVLRIIDPNPAKWFSTDEKATEFNKLIRATFQRYHQDNMPIESFHLRMNIEENYLSLEDVKNWIRLAVSRSCLKEFSLDIGFFRNDSTLTLPNEILSSENLHIISVQAQRGSGHHLQICTNPPVINCVSLRILALSFVIITPDIFHNLLSTCILLEKVKLLWCYGLKNVKVQNLLHLSELEILSIENDDHCEINNVPRLCSFRYRHLYSEHIPFQIDSLASLTQLCIEGVIIHNSFFKTVESKFSVLESLTLGIEYWKDENMAITSASLKWLTLELFESRPMINVQVYAPRLLSFTYTGNIPGLLFGTTAPKKVKLSLILREHSGTSFFLNMRKILNSSSNFDIYIRHDKYREVPLNIDVDDLRRRVSSPVGDVKLAFEPCVWGDAHKHAWEQSRFFDALFLICHPSYIRSSSKIILQMMKGTTTDLKEVQRKNPSNGNWEAVTTSGDSTLRRLGVGIFEHKLTWFPR